MFDLLHTLFRYKDKTQKDELGYYPEKVDVRAFPERRYLWTSRFFVVFSCFSLCLSMILGAVLCILIPMKRARVIPLQIDYDRYQITYMEPAVRVGFAGNLATESILAQYITERYTIGDNLKELQKRLGDGEFVYLSSDQAVYNEFTATEQPYFELLYNQGIRRRVEITRIYPVSFDFWQVRFNTIDTKENEEKPIVRSWIATIRMRFNFAKYANNKDDGIKNPLGLTVLTYNLSYMGSNVNNKRK